MHTSVMGRSICGVLLAACTMEFDPSSQVSGVRILAMQADLPYAKPGERVNLKALVVDGQGRTLTWGYSTCTVPQDPAARACVARPDSVPLGAPDARSSLALRTGAIEFGLTVPLDVVNRVPEEARIGSFIGVNLAVCPGELRAEIGAQGLPIACRLDNGALANLPEYDTGTKRIYVRQVDRNTNPVIERVTWNGQIWSEGEVRAVLACASAEERNYSLCEGEAADIAVVPAAASFERGRTEFGDSFAEQLVVQYYAPDGIFEYGTRTGTLPETRYKGRQGSKGKVIEMIFVLRDDRGGVAWTRRSVRIE
jgi:hypothetical protein